MVVAFPDDVADRLRSAATTARLPPFLTVAIGVLALLGPGCSTSENPESSGLSVQSNGAAEASGLPVLESGTLPPGERYVFKIRTHCGVAVIGQKINGLFWTTTEATSSSDWMPTEWFETLEPRPGAPDC